MNLVECKSIMNVFDFVNFFLFYMNLVECKFNMFRFIYLKR